MSKLYKCKKKVLDFIQAAGDTGATESQLVCVINEFNREECMFEYDINPLTPASIIEQLVFKFEDLLFEKRFIPKKELFFFWIYKSSPPPGKVVFLLSLLARNVEGCSNEFRVIKNPSRMMGCCKN